MISYYGPELVFDFPLETNPGWTVQGQWAFGDPAASAARTASRPAEWRDRHKRLWRQPQRRLFDGRWRPVLLDARPAGSPRIARTTLQFQRWLNSDYQPYVYATLDVSSNGSTWTPVWSNGTSVITSNAWSLQQVDISAVADNQPRRMSAGAIASPAGAYAYSGWNIDDVQLIGVPSVLRGDIDCDGTVGFGDITPLRCCCCRTRQSGRRHTPAAHRSAANINGDGTVGFEDINPFVTLLSGAGSSSASCALCAFLGRRGAGRYSASSSPPGCGSRGVVPRAAARHRATGPLQRQQRRERQPKMTAIAMLATTGGLALRYPHHLVEVVADADRHRISRGS